MANITAELAPKSGRTVSTSELAVLPGGSVNYGASWIAGSNQLVWIEQYNVVTKSWSVVESATLASASDNFTGTFNNNTEFVSNVRFQSTDVSGTGTTARVVVGMTISVETGEFRNGSGAPSDSLGVDGDFYIDTTAKKLYGPKTDGAWGSALIDWTAMSGTTGSFSGLLTASAGINTGTSQAINSTTSRLEQIGGSTIGTWSATGLALNTLALSGVTALTTSGKFTMGTSQAIDGTTSRLEQIGGSTIGTWSATGLALAGITLSAGLSALSVTATLSNTSGGQIGVYEVITSAAGSSAQNMWAHAIDLLGTNTTNTGFIALTARNYSTGTGNSLDNSIAMRANTGLYAQARGTTTGYNTAGQFDAYGSTTGNIGVISSANNTNNATGYDIAVVGIGENTGGGPQVGGFFLLGHVPTTVTSAALIADNGTKTSDIFLGRDNGSIVFQIMDGGMVGIGTAAVSSRYLSLGAVSGTSIVASGSINGNNMAVTSGGKYSNSSDGNSYLQFNNGSSNATQLNSNVADGASNIGLYFNNNITMSTTGAKLASFRNNGTEKAYIGFDGGVSVFSLTAANKFISYNGITTAGQGVPVVAGYGTSAAAVAAVASVATYTVGAADGLFDIHCNVNVTTSTAHNFGVVVTYTDETNTSRSLTVPMVQLAGTVVAAITNVTGAGPYEGVKVTIRAKAATTITITTAGTFTTVTYNVFGSISQVQ